MPLQPTAFRLLSPVPRRFARAGAAAALALLVAACAAPGDGVASNDAVHLAAQTPERVHAAPANYRSNDCEMLARFLPVMQHEARITAGFQHTVYGWHVAAIEQVQREKGCNEFQAATATAAAATGQLGLQLDVVTPQVARTLGMDAPRGALVASAGDDSPAARAGLQPRDVILEVAGQRVQTPAELRSIVGLMAPGARVPLRVWREKAVTELSIEVAASVVPGAHGATTTARR